MNAVRILLVEDDKSWHGILQEKIRSAAGDAEIRGVWSFEEADTALQQDGPWNLLVTDIGLPPYNQHQHGRRLVRRARELKVPCVVVSGTPVVNCDDVRNMLLEEGALDYFDKPRFDDDKFQARIRTILDGPPPPPRPESQGLPARLPQSIKVTIVTAKQTGDYVLNADNGRSSAVLKGEVGLFLAFALKVAADATAHPTCFEELNKRAKMGPKDDPKNASMAIRNLIRGVNKRLRKEIGSPADGKPWIVSIKNHGAHLNTSIAWDLDRDLRRTVGRTSQSVSGFPLDPFIMGGNTPDPHSSADEPESDVFEEDDEGTDPDRWADDEE